VTQFCRVFTWLNVCVVAWRHETRADDVKWVSDSLYRLSKDHRDGVGFVQFLDDRSESLSLDADARTGLSELLRRGKPYIKCSSIIFTGEGFRASAVRAVVTSIAWLARSGFPHQVFGTASAAAEAQAAVFAPRDAAGPWAERLAGVVAEARDATP
jgi:hypothetical protein